MTYKYKVSPKVFILSWLAFFLDVFLLPLIVKEVWNRVVTDVLDIRRITYIQALALKFGYSAFKDTWFSDSMYNYSNQERFHDYARMISDRLLQVANAVHV